ncbi:MAG: hypothetical protein J6V10_10195, partial [Clostridia bacterium]|nr:hypothetical protein [Clostridia bacterium]
DDFDAFEPEPAPTGNRTATISPFTNAAETYRHEEQPASQTQSGFDDYSRTFGYEPPGDDDVPPDDSESMYGDDED